MKQEVFAAVRENPAGALYIHIPFCGKKCPYCDFYSVTRFSSTDLADYTERLCGMISTLPKHELESVYFGGGTPSLLRPEQVEKILEAAARRAGLAKDAEVTLEVNPAGGAARQMADYAKAGVNRVSVGLQSADPRFLGLLGRTHKPDDGRKTVEAARKAGMDNVSLDVLWGIPGQTREELASDVHFCADIGAAHISAYLLKVEPGTPFAEDGGKLDFPDDDVQAQLYLHGVQTLEDLGYPQYEISSFGQCERRSRHNMVYWKNRPYYGLGPGAHGFTGKLRYAFPRKLDGFLTCQDPWQLAEVTGTGGGAEEYVMLGLRLREGLSLKEAAQKHPEQSWERWQKTIPLLSEKGLIEYREGGLSLTPKGMLLSNSVIGFLLEQLG